MPDKDKWVLLGGDSLLGKEVREVLGERDWPVLLVLCGSHSDERALTEDDGELLVMEQLDTSTLEDARALLLASAPEQIHEALSLLRGMEQKPAVVDLTCTLEDHVEARLRAPVLEDSAERHAPHAIHVVAHPAAAVLARLLILLDGASKLRHAVATIFEPVSARGRAGVDELHRQTVALFSFQGLPKAVFDTQVSFNLLPRYGEQTRTSLAEVEQRVEKHLATLLGPHHVPFPSIRVVHAPVFHAHCFSLWSEFEHRPAAHAVEALLENSGVDLRRSDLEPASNLTVAGQSGITVSDVLEDRVNPRGLWLWGAADNLRTIAENAILVAACATRRERV